MLFLGEQRRMLRVEPLKLFALPQDQASLRDDGSDGNAEGGGKQKGARGAHGLGKTAAPVWMNLSCRAADSGGLKNGRSSFGLTGAAPPFAAEYMRNACAASSERLRKSRRRTPPGPA